MVPGGLVAGYLVPVPDGQVNLPKVPAYEVGGWVSFVISGWHVKKITITDHETKNTYIYVFNKTASYSK